MLRVMTYQTYGHLIFNKDQASNDEVTQETTMRKSKTKNRIDQCQSGNSIEQQVIPRVLFFALKQ